MILGYRVVEATGALGPWKVTTATYYYQLLNDNEKEILSYHWHPKEPNTYSLPHLHLGSGSTVTHGGLRKAHLPTGRVAVEDILLLAILHLGVAPRRTDWEEVLNETKAKFEQYKTWG